MNKLDIIIEILAWLCIIAILSFCLWFNHNLNVDDSVAINDTALEFIM